MAQTGSVKEDEEAPAGFIEMRLDKHLAELHKEVSRSRIQKAIRNGLVLVNGQKVLEPDFQISESDKIQLPEFKGDELTPYEFDLKVVYENDDLAVIDKPAGLVVHPGAANKENTLANALLHRFPGIEKVGDPHRPGIVHRLDEDTSGLILIAKTSESLEFLKEKFQNRSIEKEYVALAQGVPGKQHDIINVPLEKVPLKQKMKVGSGKPAITEYFLLGSDPSGQFSLLRVKLHTGRTHQIRAHLAHIGHPIIGDSVYGKPSEILDRQFLHARRLKFQLMDGTWLELESELPSELKEVLNKLKIII